MVSENTYKHKFKRILPGVKFNIKSVPLARLEVQRADDFDIFFGDLGAVTRSSELLRARPLQVEALTSPNYSKLYLWRSCEDAVKTKYATQPAERYKQMIAARKIIMDDAIVAPIKQAKNYLPHGIRWLKFFHLDVQSTTTSFCKIIIKIRDSKIRSLRLKSNI